MCFSLFRKKVNNEILSYEESLLKEYGKSNNFTKHITLLIFSDTHNSLIYDTSFLENLNTEEIDACLLLGDHSAQDIECILKFFPKEKVYGLLGNHDTNNDLEFYQIKNIHASTVEINGVLIAGFQGCVKYKENSKAPLYTQEESLLESEKFTSADILVSHDTYFTYQSNSPAHDGLKGITKVLYSLKVPLHIHGHLHEENEKILLNGTTSYSIYKYKLFRF